MEGYSVTEAASILGVPTERVWELLARGVLSGAPEGEAGMRVYLQPRPAPTPPVAEAGRPNGDGNQTEQRELSPFRELLTEFRNLTERYGQALLALGEARGEVAALRSRVDLLEARMDLRLPMAPVGLSDPGWGSGQMARAATPAPPAAPAQARPDREPPSPIPHAEDAEGPEDEHDRPGGRRRSGQRRATEAFAEALARADDPTRPELPGATETAAAMAALRDQGVAEAQETQAEAVLPRELPAADSIPSADEAPPAATPAARAEVPAEPEPQPAPELEPEPQPAPGLDVAAADGARVAVAEPAPAAPEEASVAPPIDWDPDRYTVAIEEPDWFAGEVGAADDQFKEEPVASPATEVERREPEPAVEAEPAPEAGGGPEAEPEADAEAESEAGAGNEVEPHDRPRPEEDADHRAHRTPEHIGADAETVGVAEETMLWIGRGAQEPMAPAATDEGADEMELAGGRGFAEGRAMPGAHELDDALAALDALARGAPQAAAPAPASPPEPEPEPEPVAESVAPPEAPAWPVTDAPRARVEDPWMPPEPMPAPTAHPVPVTPASRAYRRLRRIFPGS